MNILAINTAFSKSYVSLQTENAIVLKNMDSSLKQSENILGLVDDALVESKISIQNLDAIACVIGPGSFTGIRIGASLVKGFCSAFEQIKKISINSLDLIAFIYAKQSPKDSFWVVLNALSGNLFACKYNKCAKQETKPIMLSGENIERISGTIVGLVEESLELCNNYVELSSESLLEYAQTLEQKGDFCEDFIPVYLRKSQAEAELDIKQKKLGSI